MDKKICELKLNEIKEVVGGVYTATYVKPTSTLTTSSSLIKATSTATFSA